MRGRALDKCLREDYHTLKGYLPQHTCVIKDFAIE